STTHCLRRAWVVVLGAGGSFVYGISFTRAVHVAGEIAHALVERFDSAGRGHSRQQRRGAESNDDGRQQHYKYTHRGPLNLVYKWRCKSQFAPRVKFGKTGSV